MVSGDLRSHCPSEDDFGTQRAPLKPCNGAWFEETFGLPATPIRPGGMRGAIEPSQDENGKQRVLLLLSFLVLLRSSSFFSGCFLNLFGPSWFSLVLLRSSWFLSVPLCSKWFFFVLLCSCPPFLFESGVRVPSSPFGPCLYHFWTMLASCFGHWGAWAHHVPTCSQLWPPLGLWGCLFGSILVPLGSIWGLWGSIWLPLGLHLGALGPHFGAMWPHPCPLGGLWPTSAK
jgi:hypothetical protein